MKIFKSVDDRLKDLGFTKVADNDCYVAYERKNEQFNYVQCMDIMHKASGKHIASSYQKGRNSDGFNNDVGFTYLEAKLITKKMKQKGWKSK